MYCSIFVVFLGMFSLTNGAVIKRQVPTSQMSSVLSALMLAGAEDPMERPEIGDAGVTAPNPAASVMSASGPNLNMIPGVPAVLNPTYGMANPVNPGEDPMEPVELSDRAIPPAGMAAQSNTAAQQQNALVQQLLNAIMALQSSRGATWSQISGVPNAQQWVGTQTGQQSVFMPAVQPDMVPPPAPTTAPTAPAPVPGNTPVQNLSGQSSVLVVKTPQFGM